MANLLIQSKQETASKREERGPLWYLARNRNFVAGMVILLVIGVVPTLIGLTVDPTLHRTGSFPARQGPSLEAPLGTDSLGRSVAIEMTDAIPNSLQIGLIAATLSTLIGTVVGFASGYFGGIIDTLARITIDVFLAVPSILFLILVGSLLRGVDLYVMALFIGLFAWAWPARQIRAQVLSLKERSFVEVARMSGMSGMEIALVELLPHMIPWLGANFVNAVIAAILAESGLAIIGLGPQGVQTIGMMIFWALEANAIFLNYWWWWTPPVLTLILLFLSLYLIHLGFDEVTNPRIRAEA